LLKARNTAARITGPSGAGSPNGPAKKLGRTSARPTPLAHVHQLPLRPPASDRPLTETAAWIDRALVPVTGPAQTDRGGAGIALADLTALALTDPGKTVGRAHRDPAMVRVAAAPTKAVVIEAVQVAIAQMAAVAAASGPRLAVSAVHDRAAEGLAVPTEAVVVASARTAPTSATRTVRTTQGHWADRAAGAVAARYQPCARSLAARPVGAGTYQRGGRTPLCAATAEVPMPSARGRSGEPVATSRHAIVGGHHDSPLPSALACCAALRPTRGDARP
jgi:hypothetical protein